MEENLSTLETIEEEWELSILKLINYNISGKYDGYDNHIANNLHLPGDNITDMSFFLISDKPDKHRGEFARSGRGFVKNFKIPEYCL